MKRCLWCLKTEKETLFLKKAHTIPKKLGGQNYNQNICDECNAYFGNKQKGNRFSVEEAFMETFKISRQRFLSASKTKKKTGRFKSRFFNIKTKNGEYKLVVKNSFKFHKSFQKKLCRAFKRGLYKVYLEELNRQERLGFERQYDFIREFARYNIGDYPVLYFRRSLGIFVLMPNEGATPKLYFSCMNYLVSDYGFTEIEFLGHVFGFPIIRNYELAFDRYIHKSKLAKQKYFREFYPIEQLTDIDLALSVIDSH